MFSCPCGFNSNDWREYTLHIANCEVKREVDIHIARERIHGLNLIDERESLQIGYGEDGPEKRLD